MITGARAWLGLHAATPTPGSTRSRASGAAAQVAGSFGTAGKLTIATPGPGVASVSHVAMQADGKLLVAGLLYEGEAPPDTFLARLVP